MNNPARLSATTWARRALILVITIYRWTIGLLLGPRCRFYPSCSHYAELCVENYPLHLAGWKILRRLLRCHPFHPGGVDLP